MKVSKSKKEIKDHHERIKNKLMNYFYGVRYPRCKDGDLEFYGFEELSNRDRYNSSNFLFTIPFKVCKNSTTFQISPEHCSGVSNEIGRKGAGISGYSYAEAVNDDNYEGLVILIKTKYKYESEDDR